MDKERCTNCRMMKSISKTCPCKCKHEYTQEITRVATTQRNNIYSGLVCKYCDDIQNEHILNFAPKCSKQCDYIFQSLR